MSQLQVGLGDRAYPIIIKEGCLQEVGRDLAQRAIAKKFCVVTDNHVADLYADILLKSLASEGVKAELISFPQGEANKNLSTIADLSSAMAQRKFDRKDGIIALGGGVPGDIAGFLASSYMRGIPFVQVPTTLLAQVDSSVGGKTGVDIPEGKNLVGAFYQPKAVYIDTEVLKTLDREELLGGLAEVIKYGVIWDGEFFTFLEKNGPRILALEPELINQVINICCRIKAEVVAKDERESDLRRILNYGHTIGHAVEATSNFSIIHGKAVAIGMVAAARLAVGMELLKEAEAEKIKQLIELYTLSTRIPEGMDRDTIKEYLLTDKKTIGNKVTYVLPTGIGKVVMSDKVPEDLVNSVLY